MLVGDLGENIQRLKVLQQLRDGGDAEDDCRGVRVLGQPRERERGGRRADAYRIA